METEILQHALVGFQLQKAKIDETIAAIEKELRGNRRSTRTTEASPIAEEPAAPRKRHVTAAGRRAIRKAQRARWAAWRANREGSRPTSAARGRRTAAARRS